MGIKVGSKFKTPRYSQDIEDRLTPHVLGRISERRIKAMETREIGVVTVVTSDYVKVKYEDSSHHYSWPMDIAKKCSCRRVLRR